MILLLSKNSIFYNKIIKISFEVLCDSHVPYLEYIVLFCCYYLR